MKVNKTAEKQGKNKEIKTKPIDKDGYPIKRWEKCFVCGKKFCLAFSFAQQNYSLKHFWSYWSENEKDERKFIDNFCLKNTYLDPEKRKKLSLGAKRRLCSYIKRNMLLN